MWMEARGAATRAIATGATYTPEIWMGHKEDGEGFWVALNRLQAFGF